MQYKSEKEFLENYDKSKFDLLSLTTDILILSISNEDTNIPSGGGGGGCRCSSSQRRQF